MTFNEFLLKEKEKDYFKELEKQLEVEEKNYVIYPPKEQRFLAYELTQLEKVKVVILGQDPYHGPQQAHGLAFSVTCEKLPPSLKNIFKELSNDLDIINQSGDLTPWAKQGVFLLNTRLSVRAKEANSHKHLNYESLIENTIKLINELTHPVVFILWGKPAMMYKRLITNPKHLILESPHPSPLSAYRGFFGSQVFSKTNKFLEQSGQRPIDWRTDHV